MAPTPFIDVHSHHQGPPNKQTLTVVSFSVPNPKPQTPYLKPHTPYPKPDTPYLKPQTPYPNPYTLGVHPWDIDPLGFSPDELRSLALHPDCIGIGETGLDKLRGPDLNIQEVVFREHIKIAEEVHKPLIIHCVRSWDIIIGLKKELKPTVPWIIHGYRGNSSRSGQLIAAGFYLSFGAALLGGDPGLRKSWIECPADRLFLETDVSTEPVSTLYEHGARLRNIPVSELKTYIVSNFKRVFRFHANT